MTQVGMRLSVTEWDARAQVYLAEAERLVRDVGWPAKKAQIVHDLSVQCPLWVGTSDTDGEIRINPGRDDPEAVAHEFAHGVHEAMRALPAYGKRLNGKGSNGEEFAQLIRYTVDQSLGGCWIPNQDRAMYDQFKSDWEAFRKWVES